MGKNGRDNEPVTWGELEPIMTAVKTELDEVRDTSNESLETSKVAIKTSKEAIKISKEAIKISNEALKISKEALGTANKSLRVSEMILKTVQSIEGRLGDQKELEGLPTRMARAEDEIVRLKSRAR